MKCTLEGDVRTMVDQNMTREILLTPKRRKISAAHSLECLGPDSPCQRKHGHTWWVQAAFVGKPDERGLLVDYAIVGEVVGLFDHADLDDLPLMNGLSPTGENLLIRLVDLFDKRCQLAWPHATVVRVELLEDPIPGDGHVLSWVRPGWELRLAAR